LKKRAIFKQSIIISVIFSIALVYFVLEKATPLWELTIFNTVIAYIIVSSNTYLFNKLCNFKKISAISYIKLLYTYVLSYIVAILILCLIIFLNLLIIPKMEIKWFLTTVQDEIINYSLIFLIFTMFFMLLELFKGWKNQAIAAEKNKFEELKFQYEILKNQINPHFLFNSLNILNSIIPKDTKLAMEFVQNFSKIYRYVLEKRDKDFVALSEEIEFIESYIYLIKSRHVDKIKISLNIKNISNYKIIPMSLQLLVENSIKHNSATQESPLLIEIFNNTEFLIINNNINRKNLFESSNQIGLKNLSERYKYLISKDIEVNESKNEFEVKIPLKSEN
jgi:two-component system, LytTR family, sensor kinase